MLKRWSGTKKFYPHDQNHYILFLLPWQLLITFNNKDVANKGRNPPSCVLLTHEEVTGCITEKAIGNIDKAAISAIKAGRTLHSCFLLLFF